MIVIKEVERCKAGTEAGRGALQIGCIDEWEYEGDVSGRSHYSVS